MIHGFRHTGLPVTILDVEKPEQQDEHFDLLASSLRPEGAVIVSLLPTEQQLESFRNAGTCPVFIDAEVADFSRVFVDDRHGGLLATRHLTELGHRRIGFLGDDEGGRFGFTSSTKRRQGYRDALAAAGIDRNPDHERTGPHGRDTSRRLARELLNLLEPPTAIFASSDTQAIGVLDAAKEAGLQVPRDLSIVGFDDIEIAEYLGLSTVRHPLYESGLLAAELVVEHIRNPGSPPQSVEQELEVIARATTGPPPD
jgi:LacI family transcriptional regulator